MNELKASDFQRQRLTDNAHQLAQARADAELYQRLKAAAGTIARLEREGSELTAGLNQLLADEAKEARDGLAAKVRNLMVSTIYPGGLRKSGITNAQITFRWETPRYDYQSNESPWTPMSVEGFRTLAASYPDVLAYMLEHRPDAIPAEIMELAPGDPAGAIGLHLNTLNRWYN